MKSGRTRESVSGKLVSDRRNLVVARYWAAFLWFAIAVLWASDSVGWRVLFTIPLFALALFHLTLAEVRRERNTISYRRFGCTPESFLTAVAKALLCTGQ
jgi:hypothetical protein